MGQLGADVDALDRMSHVMSVQSTAMQSTAQALTSAIEVAWWKGADADKFRGEWNGNYVKVLRKVSELLEQISKHVKQQADQQRRTSS